MAKASKTARKSGGVNVKLNQVKPCPECGVGMFATKLIKSRTTPGGMWWVCSACDYREKI